MDVGVVGFELADVGLHIENGRAVDRVEAAVRDRSAVITCLVAPLAIAAILGTLALRAYARTVYSPG